jgi:hypothetical protein
MLHLMAASCFQSGALPPSPVSSAFCTLLMSPKIRPQPRSCAMQPAFPDLTTLALFLLMRLRFNAASRRVPGSGFIPGMLAVQSCECGHYPSSDCLRETFCRKVWRIGGLVEISIESVQWQGAACWKCPQWSKSSPMQQHSSRRTLLPAGSS